MMLTDKVFREDEKAIYKLRELYSSYGYNHYKVSKFEEYDLYAHNKSFLVSQNLLTFTDTNGKLMALKPDVTLSIIKNAVADDKACYKLYYDEHVYRTTSANDGFREIMQTGLEVITNIDTYTQCEVIMLAMRSLESISGDYILDLSQMRFIEGLLETAGVAAEDVSSFLALISSKNVPALKLQCERLGIDADSCEALCKITSMYLPIEKALDVIANTVKGEKMQAAYDELCGIFSVMKQFGLTDKLYIDFSVINDMNYYDGIIFKGFINGIPDSILSGGRYDKVMEKFGKKTNAIGFAVYLDKLERFGTQSEDFDVDIMLCYDADVKPEDIIKTSNGFIADGKTVKTASAPDKNTRYRQLVKLGKEGVEIIEAND